MSLVLRHYVLNGLLKNRRSQNNCTALWWHSVEARVVNQLRRRYCFGFLWRPSVHQSHPGRIYLLHLSISLHLSSCSSRSNIYIALFLSLCLLFLLLFPISHFPSFIIVCHPQFSSSFLYLTLLPLWLEQVSGDTSITRTCISRDP